MADVRDPRLSQSRLASVAARSKTVPGSLAVPCEDADHCLECLGRWPEKGWRSTTDVRCIRCHVVNDLKYVGGRPICSEHRGETLPVTTANEARLTLL